MPTRCSATSAASSPLPGLDAEIPAAPGSRQPGVRAWATIYQKYGTWTATRRRPDRIAEPGPDGGDPGRRLPRRTGGDPVPPRAPDRHQGRGGLLPRRSRPAGSSGPRSRPAGARSRPARAAPRGGARPSRFVRAPRCRCAPAALASTTRIWAVVRTPQDRLGAVVPSAAVRNAVGDAYPWARAWLARRAGVRHLPGRRGEGGRCRPTPSNSKTTAAGTAIEHLSAHDKTVRRGGLAQRRNGCCRHAPCSACRREYCVRRGRPGLAGLLRPRRRGLAARSGHCRG